MAILIIHVIILCLFQIIKYKGVAAFLYQLSNQVFGVWTKSPHHESSHLCVPLAAARMQSLIMTLMLLAIAKTI